MKRSGPSKLAGWCAAVASGVAVLAGLPLAAQDVISRREASDEFFSSPSVRTFKIEVKEDALAALQKDNRAYVRGTVTFGESVFTDVGVHLKGMGSFRPLQEKPSFAVKFDKFTPAQRFFGLGKLMLNNASQDPTYLAELLATQMFRESGVPACRVTHAYVIFNQRPLGLYVVIEAMNRDFLRRFFANAQGNLYEAYLQDIDQKLDQDGGTDTTQNDLKQLLAATKVEDPTLRWARLNEVLDVDSYVSHLVVEMFTSHTDGYAMNRNNYRLYQDPTRGRFVFLAHGIDWAFANTGAPIRPPQGSIVTRALLQTQEGRRGYRERLDTLVQKVFQVPVLTNRVNDAVAKLVQGARTPDEAREFERCGVEMRQRLVTRYHNVTNHIAKLDATPVRFDTNGVARLTAWRTNVHGGQVWAARTNAQDKPALYLLVQKGDGIVSWRTNVFLDEGAYRFEARARIAGVTGLTNNVLERGNGAGLRVSGGKRAQQLVGDSDWQPLGYDFEVSGGGDERELVCELRGRSGEAWFDLASLRLLKRK